MKKTFILCLFATFLICSCSSSDNGSTPTDSTYIIVKNGTIYVNSSTTASNLIVKDGVVLEYNGDESKYLPTASGIVDLKGGFAYPGFHDSHCHLMEASMNANGVMLNVNWTPAQVIQAVAAKAPRIQDGHPIIGDGFSYVQCTGWSLTDLASLDDAAGNHPVLLMDSLGHNAIVNTLTMQQCNITSATMPPFGGTIVKDSGTDQPTGMLRESAMELVFGPVTSGIPDKEVLAGLEIITNYWASLGYTSINDEMGVPGGRFMRPELFKELEKYNKLPVRVNYAYTIFNLNDIDDALQYVGTDTDMVKFLGCKIFIDGAFAAGQAWTTWPHEGPQGGGSYGSYSVWTDDTYGQEYNINRIVAKVDDLGLNMHYHVQGDAGIEAILDALEAVVASKGKLSTVHTLIHLAYPTSDQIARIKRLAPNVVTTVQPALWKVEADAWVYYGEDLLAQSYPIMELVNEGISTGISTDFPVSPLAESPPLEIMYVALNTSEQFPPRTVMTMKALIDGFTAGSAATTTRTDIGSLEPGKVADMTVFDQNLFTINPADIKNAKMLATYIGGQLVEFE
jgi:predicted amidohydrolase YtcJ